jgi:hypothetical protein
MDLETHPQAVMFGCLAFLAGLAVASGLLPAQPSTPGTPSACAGGVTVLVNGQPLSFGCVLNIVAGAGVLATPKANPAIGGTDIGFTADTAVMQSLQRDQAGTSHELIAASTNAPGVTYTATGNPTLINGYQSGTWYVLIPDVPTLAGATLNIDGLGPIAISGTCSQICLLLAQSSPVKSFVVH